jgi:hypothetical protein
MLHFAFFFLRLCISHFLEQNRVPLWTSESFGEVASQNKIEFHSGLWRALEGLLLGTKLGSALDFGELLRGRFLEQNRFPLWNLESFRGVASRNKNAFCSGLHRALERLFLPTKLHSALDFGGESFGGKFTTAST